MSPWEAIGWVLATLLAYGVIKTVVKDLTNRGGSSDTPTTDST